MERKQPRLYIILNHSLKFANKDACILQLKNVSINEELGQYLFYASHLSNKEPENIQNIQIVKQDTDGEICLILNNIHIKIQKHIIQLQFPIIFRAFFDYDFLRIAICKLLKKLFTTCGSTEMSVYPSYWLHASYEIKNDWHEKRLFILQEKICNKCTSYKRTKLNLQQCLFNKVENVREMRNKKYKGWFVESFHN